MLGETGVAIRTCKCQAGGVRLGRQEGSGALPRLRWLWKRRDTRAGFGEGEWAQEFCRSPCQGVAWCWHLWLGGQVTAS